MKSPIKLDASQKHVLKLIARDRNNEGYAKINEKLYSPLSKLIPAELAVFEKLEVHGRAKLTPLGENIVAAMEWLV